MRPVVAIVPVKALDSAKSRLESSLDADRRIALVVAMLRGVLRALESSGAIGGRLVVSPDSVALAIAREAGSDVLRQRGDGLNEALEQARLAVGPGVAIVALSADLPLLDPDDVWSLMAAAARAPVVIAPDRAETGTNALALAADVRLPFAFGHHSFLRHLIAADAADLKVEIFRSRGTATDLDTPSDLEELQRAGWPPIGELITEPMRTEIAR